MPTKQYMLPPWMAYAQGEEPTGEYTAYLEQWQAWREGLSPEEREACDEWFPSPVVWKANQAEAALLRQGLLCLPVWQEGGTPRYTRRWALEAMGAGTMPQVIPFWGHTPAADGSMTKACFSQWWQSRFTLDGTGYCCMEQCMMAGKAMAFEDAESLRAIMAATDPKKIKALGRKVTPFDPGIWDRVKHTLIINGNYAKFTQHADLRRFLLATGDSLLVEASPYDRIWGIGIGPENPDVQRPDKWRGQNLLGFALMEVRDEIRRVYAHAGLCDDSL